MKEVKNPVRREAVISFLISASSIVDSLITLDPEYGATADESVSLVCTMSLKQRSVNHCTEFFSSPNFILLLFLKKKLCFHINSVPKI